MSEHGTSPVQGSAGEVTAAAPRDMVEVTVIIPVHDDQARLRLCLEALAEQDLPRTTFEVIVVDDGSTDDVAGVVAGFPNVRLVRQRQSGSYAARNRGITLARGRVLAFTDSDCLPDKAWLRHGVEAVREPSVGLAGGRIQVHPVCEGKLHPVEAYDLVKGFPQEKYVSCRGFAATANAFTRRDVLERVGPFDADLASGGDFEWGQRVGRAGYSATYADRAVVHHPARATWREMRTKLKRVHGGAARLSATEPSGLAPLRMRDLLPPVGAWRRACGQEAHTSTADRIAFVAGEAGVRYLGLYYRAMARLGAQR
jgi:glycosyltransferase involved in cell wall biosynthesis